MISAQRGLLTAISLVAVRASVFGYGPTGHEIVGGIADKLIANTPPAKKVYALTDGITLERASTIADEIKAWDKDGPDDPTAFPRYSEHPTIDKQVREFWRANQPTDDRASQVPSHHWFHYTDIPALNPQRYADAKTGRREWDIVHMIPYCVGILRGNIPEDNPRKITKPLALILLAHYVGDIHQPLHVGAMYFDERGRAVDPDRGSKGIEDEGGNTIMLRLYRGTTAELAKRGLKLHGFWDTETVLANLGAISPAVATEEKLEALELPKRRLINEMVREQPSGWRLPPDVPVKDYAEVWADEILPLAREAHQRIRFINVHPEFEENRAIAAGTALEKTGRDQLSYADWAAKIVRAELHKAGWRLADLLSQALTSTPLKPNRP
jgi:hypothetical protein